MYQRGSGFPFNNLSGFASSIRFFQQPVHVTLPQMSSNSNSRVQQSWPDFIPLENLTRHNFQQSSSGSNIQHNFPPQRFPAITAQPARLLNTSAALNGSSSAQKRRMNETESSPKKKQKTSNSFSPFTLPVEPGNFLIPVTQGTEKITHDIWEYFLASQMNEEDLKKKLKLRKCIFSVMTGAFPNCRLFIVGSSMTGFATKTSDVDMCLMISENEIDQRRDATVILSSIAKALRACSFVRSPQVIKAKVPIFKFFDAVSGVECDLNINNTVGVRNTHLLRYYAYMDWRVRPLMLFIKKWARFHDINDASKKTISSYSLTLMLIHYLQAGVCPAVLPCLQTLKPHLFSTQSDVCRLSLNFEPDNVKFESKNVATLGELFLGFLNYYSNIFCYESQVISVRLGRTISRFEIFDRDNNMQWKHLNIEEPFDRTNTARSVYDLYVFQRIVRVFKVSFNTLVNTRDVSKILSRPF